MLDLAEALLAQRERVRGDAPLLMQLREAVGAPASLTAAQWLQLYAFALELRPDLIVELGRGNGNSTCVFTQAAAALPRTEVVSIGFDTEQAWTAQTAPRLRGLVSGEWFAPLQVRHEDILAVDFADVFGRAPGRVLLFWDAHGVDLGAFVLSLALPLLEGREHVVAVHDVTDGRHEDPGPAYVRADGLPSVWQGPLVSPFRELVPLYDFLSRNRLPFETAAASLDRRRAELAAAYAGADPYPLEGGHWMWFAVEPPPGRLPAYPPYRSSRLRSLRTRLAARGFSLVAPPAEE